jgi:septum site-determining protein MinC
MSAVPPARAATAFEFKSASLTLIALVLRTADLDALTADLDARLADTPALFDHDPVVVDLAPLRDADAVPDFEALVALLRSRRIVPVAVRGGSALQMAAAHAAGLGEAPEAPPRAAAGAMRSDERAEVVLTEVIREVPAAAPTLIVDRPLRSGQQIYARGGDLVVLAVVSHGAEVIADGSIHVYAPLRGRAIAGARGDTAARIFSTCMQPQLLCVAGTYRTTETALPDDVAGRPAQVRLDGERLVVEALRS